MLVLLLVSLLIPTIVISIALDVVIIIDSTDAADIIFELIQKNITFSLRYI